MSKRQPGPANNYALTFKQAYQPLARSTTFVVQLALLFGLSSGSMFIAKGWLYQQGLVNTNSSQQASESEAHKSARVIWPSVPTLFPLPASKQEQATALASFPQLDPEVKVAQQYVYQAPSQAPRLSYKPQLNTRRVLKPQARQQARQQRVSWRGAQLPKAPQRTQKTQARQQTQIPQVRRILKHDYGVKKTASYSESMKWVRETLKSYN